MNFNITRDLLPLSVLDVLIWAHTQHVTTFCTVLPRCGPWIAATAQNGNLHTDRLTSGHVAKYKEGGKMMLRYKHSGRGVQELLSTISISAITTHLFSHAIGNNYSNIFPFYFLGQICNSILQLPASVNIAPLLKTYEWYCISNQC